jgi:hypothetical protein
MSSGGPRPTIGGVVALAPVVIPAVFVWRAASGAEPAPGFPPAGPAGAEQQRLERQGPLGASYRRAVRAGRAEAAAPRADRPLRRRRSHPAVLPGRSSGRTGASGSADQARLCGDCRWANRAT